ncbi:hypothetical protein ACIBJD_23695 [Kitasatospora sp. NPDC050467]|uniref:hypothetical protein n=1 Tax=Kitasatospora sp. NPDC050467 TaxID=3364053 RepID=UPI0037A3B64D
MVDREPQAEEREQARTAAESFAAELCRLRREAGQPSFRTMAKKAGSISHTTLYEAASGSRLPSWPTTRAYVQACGGDEAEWRRRWSAATGREAAPENPPTRTPPAVPPQPTASDRPADEPSAPPAVTPAGPSARGHRLWTHAVALLVGALVGVCSTLGVLSFHEPVAAAPLPQDCPTEDPAPVRSPATDVDAAGPPAGAPRPATEQPATAADPAWVARPAADQQALPGTDVVLPVLSPVVRGDALVVTMMLTSTCPGSVTVTDTRGDPFETAGDVTDSRRHRVLVFAAFGVPALTTADSIHVTYPHASKYHIAVDEFRGISVARGTAQAHGPSGGTTFTTSATPATCARGDLMVGTAGTNTGTAPEFGTGWTALPVLALSSYRLTTAYQVATADGPCAATGRTTSQWGAVLTVFH